VRKRSCEKKKINFRNKAPRGDRGGGTELNQRWFTLRGRRAGEIVPEKDTNNRSGAESAEPEGVRCQKKKRVLTTREEQEKGKDGTDDVRVSL